MGATQTRLLPLALLAVLLTGCGTLPTSTSAPPPVEFAVGTPATLTSAANASTFGRFVATAGSHTISLSALTSNYGWSLFSSPSYVADGLILRCDAHSDASDESCPVSLLIPGHTYYLRIDEESGVAGSFTVTIT